MIWGGDAQHPFLCHISSQHLGHMGVPVSEPSSPAVPLGCFAHHVAVLLFRLYLASVSINSFP